MSEKLFTLPDLNKHLKGFGQRLKRLLTGPKEGTSAPSANSVEREQKAESERLCVAETLLSMAAKLLDVDWQSEPYLTIKTELVETRKNDMESLASEAAQMALLESDVLYQKMYSSIELEEAAKVRKLNALGLAKNVNHKDIAPRITHLRVKEELEKRFYIRSRELIRKLSDWFWDRMSQETGVTIAIEYQKINPDESERDELNSEMGMNFQAKLTPLLTNPDQQLGIFIKVGLPGWDMFNTRAGTSHGLADNHMAHLQLLRNPNNNTDQVAEVSQGILNTPKTRYLDPLDLKIGVYEIFAGTDINKAGDLEEPWNAIIVTKQSKWSGQ